MVFTSLRSTEIKRIISSPGCTQAFSTTPVPAKDIYQLGAMGYHFGDAIDLVSVLPESPEDVLVMGNISPSEQLLGGTPESVTAAVRALREKCGAYPNFVLSSGCDVPPMSPWENIDAFFRA